MLNLQSEKAITRLIAIGAASVTIFVLTGSVSDPVNSTKFLLLGGISVAAASIFFTSGWKVIGDQRLVMIFGAIFIFASINAVLQSKSPIQQNIYGTYGRNTGFLTYVFLLLILISATSLREKQSFKLIIYGLIFAGVVNVIYCLNVLTFGDFIPWNNPYGNILGTFGNPNFIGAFLGFFTAALIAFALTKGVSLKIRILTCITALVSTFEIIKSHAIQGRVVLAAGLAIVGFFLIRSKFKSNLITYLYSVGVAIAGFIALLGALQIGPLTKYIYKTSVSLRGEYWKAGLTTAKHHLFTGVGFDTYGDWYRRSRDAQALILPGPETISNAAHNVPIDVFAFGGLPLLVPYLAFIALVLIAIVRHTLKNRQYDGLFVALTTAWFGYQLQSVISINQIGLAIWGWLLGGTIIAYTTAFKSETLNDKKTNISTKSRKQKEQIFSAQLIGGLGMVVGLIISSPPISADAKFQSAMKSANIVNIETSLKSSYLTPTDTVRILNAVQIFEQNKFYDLSYKYVKIAVAFNPENYDSWRSLYLVKNSTVQDKTEAKKHMILLDPLNAELKKLA
jgi:hypothetical protein